MNITVSRTTVGTFADYWESAKWTKEEAIEKLTELERECSEIDRLSNEVEYTTQKAYEIPLPQEPVNMWYVTVLPLCLCGFLYVFENGGILIAVALIAILYYSYKKMYVSPEDKKNYAQKKEEILAERKKYLDKAEELNVKVKEMQNKLWWNKEIPPQHCNAKDLQFLRMALVTGQAENMEVAVFQLEQKKEVLAQNQQLQRQIDELQSEVAYATQKAADAEATIDNARFWGTRL